VRETTKWSGFHGGQISAAGAASSMEKRGVWAAIPAAFFSPEGAGLVGWKSAAHSTIGRPHRY